MSIPRRRNVQLLKWADAKEKKVENILGLWAEAKVSGPMELRISWQ
jgi:hypothetical protein